MKTLVVGANAITAKTTSDLSDIFTADNCVVVYLTDSGGNYKSWKPSAELNAITQLVANSGYIVIMKETLDVSDEAMSISDIGSPIEPYILIINNLDADLSLGYYNNSLALISSDPITANSFLVKLVSDMPEGTIAYNVDGGNGNVILTSFTQANDDTVAVINEGTEVDLSVSFGATFDSVHKKFLFIGITPFSVPNTPVLAVINRNDTLTFQIIKPDSTVWESATLNKGVSIGVPMNLMASGWLLRPSDPSTPYSFTHAEIGQDGSVGENLNNSITGDTDLNAQTQPNEGNNSSFFIAIGNV